MEYQCSQTAESTAQSSSSKKVEAISVRRRARILQLSAQPTKKARPPLVIPPTPTPAEVTRALEEEAKTKFAEFDKNSDIKDNDEDAPIFYNKKDCRTERPLCLIPPERLWHKIPNFNKTSSMEHCHEHNQDVEIEGKVRCRDCKVPYDKKDIHVLPCGHVLCLDCLYQAAWTIVYNLCDRDCLKYFLECKKIHDKQFAKKNEKAPKDMMSLEAMGAICCNMDTNLLKFKRCFPPMLAQLMWLSKQLLKSSTNYMNLRCGWPDCRQFMPISACFKRGDGDDAFFCVNCGGCSKMQADSQKGGVRLYPTYSSEAYMILRCGWSKCQQFVKVSTCFKGDGSDEAIFCRSCHGFSEIQSDSQKGGVQLCPKSSAYINLRCGWPDCREFVKVSTWFKGDDSDKAIFCRSCRGFSDIKSDSQKGGVRLCPKYSSSSS